MNLGPRGYKPPRDGRTSIHKEQVMVNRACTILMLAALTATAAVAQSKPAAPGADKPIGARVNEVFAQFDKPDSPGCALAVIKDGQIVHKRGYGMSNLEYGVPISPSSIFHIASISKEFTAMAIVMLAQQGKLSLDDDVRKYVPEVPDFGERITIRHLIHHTSGLRDQWALLDMAGWREDDVITEGDILDLISRQKALNFKPGEEHLYSNTGYTLLAVIVKRVSGQSLRDFADANIFKPLGMTRTHFHDDHSMIVKDRTSAYQPRTGGGLKISIPVFDTYGATSLFTTVEDMAKWDQNFVDKKVGGDGAIEQMLTPGVLNNGKKLAYAFGLSVGEYKGLKTVGHGGSDAGYRADFIRFPDQNFSVVCLCNLSTSNPGTLTRRVADIYLADKLTQPPPRTKPAAPPDAGAVKLTEQELASKAGIYTERKTNTTVRLEMKDGKLMAAMGPGLPLLPMTKDRFQVAGAPATVSFEGAANGHPERMLVLNDGEKEALVFEYVAASTPPSAASLAEYSGVYYSEELDTRYTVLLKGETLVVRRRKFEDMKLAPKSPDEFVVADIGSIKFTRDSEKRVAGFEINAGRIRHLRFSKESH
ncbi:MAG TPA: serine hydrolase domain-containing protein [Blastocatellia bacterium]|nr:serine hydrolase domain-containing protein [Blastocatellia bacterium]